MTPEKQLSLLCSIFCDWLNIESSELKSLVQSKSKEMQANRKFFVLCAYTITEADYKQIAEFVKMNKQYVSSLFNSIHQIRENEEWQKDHAAIRQDYNDKVKFRKAPKKVIEELKNAMNSVKTITITEPVTVGDVIRSGGKLVEEYGVFKIVKEN